MNGVLRHLRRAALRAPGPVPSDAQLLEAFLGRRDEGAFETLMRRHGPVVFGVCRRILGNVHDAEDAFQATFLVLARKAGSLLARDLLAGWLYGVAYRTAMKARAMNATRRAKERRAAERKAPPAADGHADDLLARLDAELNRLPEKYRVPVVLCELQGCSRRDAARALGLAEGTLSWRLAHARKLLTRALSRPGAPFPAAALTAVLAEGAAPGAVPAALVVATARAAVQTATPHALAAGAVSAHVRTLTEGVMKAMLLSKLKTAWALALALSLGVGGIGLTYRAVAAEPAQTPQASPADKAVRDELEEMRLEIQALRKGLQATRERVKALEGEVQAQKAEVQAQKQRADQTAAFQQIFQPYVTWPAQPLTAAYAQSADLNRWMAVQPNVFAQTSTAAAPADPLADAEAALKALRQNANDQKAADSLDSAVKQIRERASKAPAGQTEKKR